MHHSVRGRWCWRSASEKSWSLAKAARAGPGEQSALTGTQGTVSRQLHQFRTMLEPDGQLGHWMKLDAKLQQATGLSAGDTATVEVEPLKDWPEPQVPQDFEAALAAAPQKIQEVWKDITPMARWEWVRWVNCNAKPRHTPTTGRGEHLEDEQWQA